MKKYGKGICKKCRKEGGYDLCQDDL
jgi:hypothetical protein